MEFSISLVASGLRRASGSLVRDHGTRLRASQEVLGLDSKALGAHSFRHAVSDHRFQLVISRRESFERNGAGVLNATALIGCGQLYRQTSRWAAAHIQLNGHLRSRS